jgi:RND superfamily putative drug exporter
MSAYTRTEDRAPARPPRSRFQRLAAWSYKNRRRALALWLAVLIGVTAGASAIGSNYHNDFSLPGTESQRAVDTLEAQAPAQSGDTIQIVMQYDDGLRTQEARDRVEEILGDVRGLPHVAGITGPYENDATALSRDGTIGYATVALDAQSEEVPVDDVRRMIDVAQAGGGDGLRVELGGDAVGAAEESEGGAAEGAGLLAALVILVFLFGSLLAATLPLATAIFAVGTTLGLIVLGSHLANFADFTPPLMTLVGLGVGIDYALLIFSRFRSELLAGAPRETAMRTALDTAGRSVFFAGLTVIIALLGLVALGLASLQGVALAVALTVLVTMLASLTLLPALLALTGRRIERRIKRRAERAKRPDGERWRRWSGFVQRRPWPTIAVAVAVLLALSAPALDMRLGFADAGNDAKSTTSRQAYDLLAEGFGPGFNGPLVVVAEGGDGAATELQRTLERTPGVAGVTPPTGDGDVSTVVAFPDSKPQDPATDELVSSLREDVLPPLAQETDARFLVGGPTASESDFSDAVADRLPLFVAIVVGLSALLLMAVFRSVLIPLKAALLNLLSIGASLGVMTLVFQEGLFGVEPGPIEAFIPVMIFAIVFGLSMDYEVFLLSRMHEEWERNHDARRAISEGVATTGRVVTAAAAIMIVVFGSFVLAPDRFLQQFGLGLAVAILFDAFVIRSLIVPAVMQLLGERAWWLPSWLGRRLPRVAIEPGVGGAGRAAEAGRGAA